MSVTCYYYIIKTRPICMFRYMSHTIYLRIQVERGWLLETDRDRRTRSRACPGQRSRSIRYWVRTYR